MSANAGSFYGIVAILFWSTTVAIVRSICTKIDPFRAGALTFFISSVIGGLYLILRRDFDLVLDHSMKYLLVCGILFVVYTLALFIAIDRARDTRQAMELGLINYLWPSLTVLLSLMLTRQQVSIMLPAGILGAFAGVFIVITSQLRFSWRRFALNIRSNRTAYFAALVAAVSWATYSNLTNLWANPEATSAVFVFIPITGLVFFIFSRRSNEKVLPIQAIQRRTRFEILFFGFSTILSYVFWDMAMRRGNVSFVAILSFFTPFFSTLGVSTYHKEAFPRKLWVGCILIVLGSLVSWISII